MKLENYLSAQNLLIHADVANKAELFGKMAGVLSSTEAAKAAKLDKDMILKAIEARENQVSTRMNDDFAIPHARLPQLNNFALCITTLNKPMEYDAGKSIKYACMLIVPESKPETVIKLISVLVKMLSMPGMPEAMLRITKYEEFIDFIKSQNLDLDFVITGRDLMRQEKVTLPPDMPLRQATRIMSEKGLTNLPVVDENGVMVGEVNTEKLFFVGMPDFFKMLKSVSFVANFDPFEDYFKKESNMLVKDVMTSDFCALKPENTILEVVYAITVKRYQKIYITTPENKLLGVIDHALILEKIIDL